MHALVGMGDGGWRAGVEQNEVTARGSAAVWWEDRRRHTELGNNGQSRQEIEPCLGGGATRD